MIPTTAPLALSLGHAGALLARARGAGLARTQSLADLHIDLPGDPLGIGGTIDRAALDTLATLYFLAEIEGTHLVSVAEILAAERFTLALTDRAAAEALETLAEATRRGWVDRALRNQIFARHFGLGYDDPNLGETAVNREFEPRFARFCTAVAGMAQAQAGWAAPGGAAARLAIAAQALVSNLAGRTQANTLIVAERLTGQMKQALAVMNHPGLVAVFRGRTAWDVLRAVLGEDTPDLDRAVTRAQTGLRLTGWLSDVLGPVGATDTVALEAAARAEPGLAGWAEMWLDASGAAPPQGAWQ